MMLESIRKTTADRVNLPPVHVYKGMDDYSGWNHREHLEWISDLSGLPYVELLLRASDGYHFFTDDSVSEVWMLSNDYYKTTARLIYED